MFYFIKLNNRNHDLEERNKWIEFVKDKCDNCTRQHAGDSPCFYTEEFIKIMDTKSCDWFLKK